MKTKLTLMAVAAVSLLGSTALADNPQLRNDLRLQRAAEAARNERTPTVAVQVRGRGVGERTATSRGHYSGDSDTVVLQQGRGQTQTVHTSPR
jgi:hypothetical protein